MSSSKWGLQDLTPDRISAINAHISHVTADMFGMPSRCRRRSCRRGHCSAALAAASHGGGEPECVSLLKDYDRAFFGVHTESARLIVGLLRDWKGLPVVDGEGKVFLLRQAVGLANWALHREPAARMLARAWLRRVKLPPRVAPTAALERDYEGFGKGVDVGK